MVVYATTLWYNPGMSEKIDEFHLAAWRAFLNAHAALIHQIEDDLEQAQRLPLSSYDVVLTLAEAPEHRLRMHEIAERVVLSRSGLTRLIDRLEKDGLLYRERCGDDRRGAYAVLSEKGLEALRRAWPVYAHGIQKNFASLLNDEEVRILTSALERVNAAARNPC
jgi:DNA-binding MarR family transcriptional regulator